MSLSRHHLLTSALLFGFACLFPTGVAAEVFHLAHRNDSVIGEIQQTRTSADETLLDIARAHGLGYQEIKRVNPTLDTWLPGTDREVILPSRYVLPMTRHDGIVLNIPEMRLYYYPPGQRGDALEVITYPLGVGRSGWHTPYVDTRIIAKKKHPAWIPPASIREEHAVMGDPLPKRVLPGPENPLGDYALRLGLPGYLIHGTNKPFGIGMRVSHGCIRLYPEDIHALFKQVKVRTPVHIVNQPYKVGRLNNKIYLEAHPFLAEDRELYQDNLTSVVKMVVRLTAADDYQIEWDLAKQVIREMNGIPVVIGRIVTPTMQADAGVDSGISLQLETGIVR